MTSRFRTIRNRAFRSIVALVSILVLTGVPAQAGPIVVRDVVQVLSSYQNPPNLRLRSPQDPALVAGVNSKPVGLDTCSDVANSTLSSYMAPPSDSLLGGVVISSDAIPVEVIAEGDVEGTICDCGEITVPGGGFPKWPLLFLAGIPLFFIHNCDDCDSPLPPDTPNPNPIPRSTTPTPEPATLLLFGTGIATLGAGLRRRYRRTKLPTEVRSTTKELSE
jgi:hypothetical protein